MSSESDAMVSEYRLIGKLGRGGMGVVWRGEDTVLRRPVALKFLMQTGHDDATMQARFLREARTAASLNHPNICTIYHVGQVEPAERIRPDADEPPVAPGTPYIVMELLAGVSLADRLLTGPLPLVELLSVLSQIADGLLAAHEAGIVHRDLKPGNVMVGEGGRTKILDFGLARPARPVTVDHDGATEPHAQTELTRKGEILGTVAYMSPEQIQGRPVGPSSDVFSFGILAQEMATGRRPFRGEGPASTMAKILEAQPEPLRAARPDLPPALEEQIGRCLRKAPEERPDSRELVDALRDLRRRCASGPKSTAALSPGRPISKPARGTFGVGGPPRVRSRWLAAGIAFAAVLAAVAAGVVMLRDGLPGAGGAVAESLVVLPLQNRSDDPEVTDYLSDGVAQSVIARLRNAGYRVVPWTTALRYRDSMLLTQQIAADLGVDAVLSGSLQLGDDGTILASMSLTHAADDRKSWSKDFTESTEHLFRLQKNIAVQAASSMVTDVARLDREALGKPESDSSEAYDWYLQGSYLMQDGDRESVDVAYDYFDHARRMDDGFVGAEVGMGVVESTRYFYGWGGMTNLEAAEQHFSRALRLDSSANRARMGLDHVEYERGFLERTLAQARETARFGREDDVETLIARGHAYWLGGLPDLGVPLFRRALELDPANEGALWYLAHAQIWAGRYREGIETCHTYLERYERLADSESGAEIHLQIAQAHHGLGELEAAQRHYEEALNLSSEGSYPYVNVVAGLLYRQIGQTERARETWQSALESLQRITDEHPDNLRMRYMGVATLLLLDDTETATAELRAIREMPMSASPSRLLVFMAFLMRDQNDAAVEILRSSPDQSGFRPPIRLLLDMTQIDPVDHPLLAEVMEDAAAEERRLRELY